MVDKFLQLGHTALAYLFCNDGMVQIHQAAEFKQRSALELFLSLLLCNRRDRGHKLRDDFRGLGVAGAHIVEQTVVVGACIPETANRVYDFGIDRDAFGILAVVECNKLNEGAEADDFNKNLDWTIAGQNPGLKAGFSGGGGFVDETEVKILINQLSGKNGVGFFFNAAARIRICGKKFVTDAVSVLFRIGFNGRDDFDLQGMLDIDAHGKNLRAEGQIKRGQLCQIRKIQMDIFTLVFAGGVFIVVLAVGCRAEVVVLCAEECLRISFGHLGKQHALLVAKHFDQFVSGFLWFQNAVADKNHLGMLQCCNKLYHNVIRNSTKSEEKRSK